MSKRKLKVRGHNPTDGAVDAVTIYFNRELSALEAQGITRVVQEYLDNAS